MAFYELAVLWAYETGITAGTDATHFSPNAICNRA
ncbi:MAG: S-layer homology domain-containing protein [Alistipes sp.]|nr:S-layer homology domain-containing protein [Alistipes sp.]